MTTTESRARLIALEHDYARALDAGDDGYRAGYRDGQEDEREAVVKWLRELAVAALSEPRLVPFERLLSDMADVIERGEHCAKVKP